MKLSEVLTNMFGFIWQGPIDETLRRMKVVYILALFVTYQWCEKLITQAMSLTSEQASMELVGLYFVQFFTLVGIFWKSVQDMRSPNS